MEPGTNLWTLDARPGHLVKPGNDLLLRAQKPAARRASLPPLASSSQAVSQAYGKKEYCGRIPGRVGISERPAVVDARSRVGDWEADLVIGRGHKGAIVTLAERRSQLYLALPILRKTVDLTTWAITTLLATFKD